MSVVNFECDSKLFSMSNQFWFHFSGHSMNLLKKKKLFKHRVKNQSLEGIINTRYILLLSPSLSKPTKRKQFPLYKLHLALRLELAGTTITNKQTNKHISNCLKLWHSQNHDPISWSCYTDTHINRYMYRCM